MRILSRELKSLFASVPYYNGIQKSYEQEWRNEIFIIFELLEMNVKSEVHTSVGRMDCVVETKSYIYIFEFKLDQSAKAV